MDIIQLFIETNYTHINLYMYIMKRIYRHTSVLGRGLGGDCEKEYLLCKQEDLSLNVQH